MKTTAERTHKRNPHTHQRKPFAKKSNPKQEKDQVDEFFHQESRSGIRSSREKSAPVFIETE
jgi:hypothetical protein